MTRRRSRREVLGGASRGLLAGTVLGALSGCLSRLEDGPEPIDADEAELFAIADAEQPDERRELPIRVTDEHVAHGIEHVETLLTAIPSSTDGEISNEAIREYVENERNEAREHLDELDAEPTNYARLPGLRRARRHAAESEAAYAAVLGERSPEELRDELDRLETERSAVDAELNRVGDDPRHAVVVYATVERRLDSAEQLLDEVGWPMPGASTVELVGDLADHGERVASSIDDATHLAERQAEVGDRRFDEAFSRVASTLRDDVTDRAANLPEPDGAAAELFDVPVEATPREEIARSVVRRAYGSAEDAADHLEDDRLSRSLLSSYDAETELRATERLQAAVNDGAYDRPADAATVRAIRADAIDAIESARDEAASPHLVERQLPIAGVRQGDWWLERGASSRPDRGVARAVASYAVATALARSIPDATEWFVDALP